MSPYRAPSERSAPIAWRVTRWQKFVVKFRRFFELTPYDTWGRYAQEYRRYEKALARWERDHGPRWTDRPGKHPPPPCAPPVPILE